jgi:hypothetical protein
MKIVTIVAALAVCTALNAASPTVSSAQAASQTSERATAGTPLAVALKQDMRKLWTDHVVWTRDYIIAAVGDQPDARAAAKHLSTTTDEVVARLNKDWDADVCAFDEVYGHILHMADALSEGIVKQFPDKFT